MIRIEILVFLIWFIGKFYIVLVYFFKVFFNRISFFDKLGIYVGRVIGRVVIIVVIILEK